MSKAKQIKRLNETDSNTQENVCVTCSTPGEWENVFILTFEDTCFSNILKYCMGLELSENSKLKYMCLECIQTIVSFYTFKQTALKSYEELCKKQAEIEICTSEDIEVQENIHENNEQILVFSIDNASLIESIEVEGSTQSNNTSKLESDAKVQLFKQLKNEEDDIDFSKDGDILVDKENTNISLEKEEYDISLVKQEDDDVSSIKEEDNNVPVKTVKKKEPSFKELKEKNLWRCSYCNIIISRDNPAEIKKHRYAEKVKRIKIHECPVCHRKYTKSVIKEHIARHGEEKSAVCQVCGKGVSSSQALKHHMMLHEGKKFTCDICNKGFTQQFLLKEHKNVHDKNKTFLCATCGMSFPNPTRLRQHQYKHKKNPSARTHEEREGDTRHICDFCGKCFSSIKTLEVHRTKHDSDVSFECARCGKKFGHRALLTSHIWLHIAEFRCQKCYKIYQKDNLRKHDCVPIPKDQVFDDYLPNECRKCGEILQHGNMDRHLRRHDERECKICGEKVSGARKLQFHMNSHKFKCELCGKGFAKKENFILHTNRKVCSRISFSRIKLIKLSDDDE